jgi:serine-type D-Ala-D-Ala carboxypeptidase (penicillin-binding protein 5/6)
MRIPTVTVPTGRWRRISLAALALLIAVGGWNYLRPVPAVAATSSRLSQYVITGTPPDLPWPATGSAAVGASHLGLIATSGDQQPAPSGSAAKVMTALVLLADKPLAVGEDGPTLIMTDQDVATYKADAKDQQSVVPVTAGERLTEYELLEALLIPSANNIADTIARWDAGSVAAFVGKLNDRSAALHLTHTTFADPSGISVQTVSTPGDLITLGMAAMQQDVVAQIVGEAQTTLPVAGLVYNTDGALGQSGIIGIKTGVNDGATFLFAANATVDGHPVTLYGCVMRQPTLAIAFDAAKALANTMESALKMRAIVARNDVVGAYDAEWGSHADVVATADLAFVEWPGMILRWRLEPKPLAVDGFVPSGTPAGKLHLVLGDQQADVPLATSGSLDPPSLFWRLSRINWL